MNLKGVLEQRILDARVEFFVREVFGIAKRKFRELIIDVVRRKRQVMTEQIISQVTDVLDDPLDDVEVGAVHTHEIEDTSFEHVAYVVDHSIVEHVDDDVEEERRVDSDFRQQHLACAI